MNANSSPLQLSVELLETVPLSPVLTCSYFHDRPSRYREFQLDGDPSPELFDRLLELGYRRCGNIYYQTRCPGCSACKGYRVPVAGFRPTRSQRRVLKRNTDVELRIVEPRLEPEKEQLYLRYQLEQHHLRDLKREPDKASTFKPQQLIETMVLQMYTNPPLTRELQLCMDDQLIGFGTLDIGRTSISAVYFVFDPKHGERSLGTLAILRGLQWAKQNGYGIYYLGYYIANHPKMAYKCHFGPAEIFDAATTIWNPVQS